MNNEKIALFPLGLVLLPGMILPLYIFEERYKSMIYECIKTNKKFGLVYYSGDKFSNIGCTAEIVRIIKEYDDGRMDILTTGGDRFIVLETHDDKPYLQATVSYFDDQYELTGEAIEEAKIKGINLLNEVMSLYNPGVQNVPSLSPDMLDPKSVSFLIASNSGFTMNEKQFFLEILNTKERLEKGVKSLQIIIERLKGVRSIEQIIQSNGYLPKKHD